MSEFRWSRGCQGNSSQQFPSRFRDRGIRERDILAPGFLKNKLLSGFIALLRKC